MKYYPDKREMGYLSVSLYLLGHNKKEPDILYFNCLSPLSTSMNIPLCMLD